MSKRKSTTPLTAEQVKALADQLSDVEQMRLHQLFFKDPASKVGKLIHMYLEFFHEERVRLEQRLGIFPSPLDPNAPVVPGEIDPERLLSTQETDQQATERTGRESTNAVKTARYKIRRKIAKAAIPPRSLPIK